MIEKQLKEFIDEKFLNEKVESSKIIEVLHIVITGMTKAKESE